MLQIEIDCDMAHASGPASPARPHLPTTFVKIWRYVFHGSDKEHPGDEMTEELRERLGNGFVKAHHLNRTNQDGFESRMAPFLLFTEASVTLQGIKNLTSKAVATQYSATTATSSSTRAITVTCTFGA